MQQDDRWGGQEPEEQGPETAGQTRQGLRPELPQDPSGQPSQQAPVPPAAAQPPAPEQPRQDPRRVPENEDGTVTVDGVTYRPAGFMPRFWAFLIDAVILSMFHALLLSLLNYKAPSDQELMDLMTRMFTALMSGSMPSADLMARFEDLQRVTRIAGWLNVAVCAAYYITFHTVASATLGKLCLGLSVLTSKGHRLSLRTSFVRYLFRFLLSKFFFGAAFTVFFDPRRRTAYDMVAGTNVFRQQPSQQDQYAD